MYNKKVKEGWRKNDFKIEVDGKTQMKKVIRQKANDYTEQVVYREKLPNGKFTSVTKHEYKFNFS